nr:hypothetical protein [uncultured Oscillibacter sp.]
MELSAWANALPSEFPKLWQCLKSNAYPSSFLHNVVKLSPKADAALPRVLVWFLAVYLLCGAVTLVLRYWKKQKPLSTVHHQVNMTFLSFLSALVIPPAAFVVRICWRELRATPPFRGEGDYVRFFGEISITLFYMLIAVAVALFIVWPPLTTLAGYLRDYRLRGLPHGIFEVGFGLCVLSLTLLSAIHGDRRVFLLLVPVVLVLGIIQMGGSVQKGPKEKKPPSAGRKTVPDPKEDY